MFGTGRTPKAARGAGAMADRAEAKRLILKILAISGGRLEAMSRLNKAFYAAHLFYWQQHGKLLSDYPVVKLPNGPGIDDFEKLVAELEAEEKLTIEKGTKGPYPQTTLVLKAAVEIAPQEPEYEAIRKAVRWVKGHTTAQLSDITHDRPSYQAQPRVGYEQAIYLDAISEEDYESIRGACARVDDAFRAALGTRR
jgi:hypothetical protein